MEVTYKLHASQFRVYHDPARFIVLAAGRRYGKTVLAMTKLITEALRIKKAQVWYVAPTYRQAEMIAWKMLFEMIPAQLIKKKNEVRLEITLVNGSEISLKGADNEDSLRGVGLDYVVLDEFASMKPNVWQEIIRPTLSDRNGKALFIGTPKGKNHFWEIFVKGERKEQGYSAYRMPTESNPYIPRSEIKEAESQMNERYFRQEYLASFEDYTGLIWPEFDGKTHEVEIKHWFESVAAIDTAISGTTAALRAFIDDAGVIWVTNEYYEQNKRVSEISSAIKGWSPSLWLIDPSAKRRDHATDGKVFSLYDEYGDNGIHPICAENDVNAGINRVAEYFRSGKLRISANCKNLLYEIERYHWSEERETLLGIAVPKPYKNLDHACDALRYIVMSRPSLSQQPIERPEGMTAANIAWMEERQYQHEEVN